jgi:hypothetical protein
MTNKDFHSLMEKTFESCKAISAAKGKDYTKGSEDALANFKEAGKDIGVDAIEVCWIFMNKHYQAITNYVKSKGQSESEPIAERIKDLINYLVLLQGIIEEPTVSEQITNLQYNEKPDTNQYHEAN